MKECSFCAEFTDQEFDFSLFHKINSNNFLSRIIWENDYFILAPTIGCFLEGYVILVPKRHISSFGALNDDELSNLEDILPEIMNLLKREYGGVVLFEHGSVSSCKIGGGACEEHAHLHFIPLNIDYRKEVKKLYCPQKIKSFKELRIFEEEGIPYLLYSTPEKCLYVCEAFHIVSQYLRQITAIKKGIPEVWNWRHFYFVQKMESTYLRLHKKVMI